MPNILINNGKLGRQGKTTLSYTIYKHSKQDYRYATNDMANASVDLSEHIPEGDLLFFPHGENIDIGNDDRNIIFDFGGEPDDRLLTIAEGVDVIVVPMSYESDSELELTVQNIKALEQVNKNIVLVINKTERDDIEVIEKVFKIAFKGMPIFTINKSRYVRRLANDNQTVFEVAETNKRDGAQLNKVVIPQFNALIDYLHTNF